MALFIVPSQAMCDIGLHVCEHYAVAIQWTSCSCTLPNPDFLKLFLSFPSGAPPSPLAPTVQNNSETYTALEYSSLILYKYCSKKMCLKVLNAQERCFKVLQRCSQGSKKYPTISQPINKISITLLLKSLLSFQVLLNSSLFFNEVKLWVIMK